MQEITIAADQAKVGDLLVMIDEEEMLLPGAILSVKDYSDHDDIVWVTLETSVRRLSERNGDIRVQRPDTQEERQTVWDRLMMSYLSGTTWTESRYPWRYSDRAKELLAAMWQLEHGDAPQDPAVTLDPDGDYANKVLERAYDSVPDEYFIIPN